MTFLKKYGITTGLGVKIYKEYGDDAIRILQENPYQLVYDIDGIGFLTADTIAKRLGFPEDHPLRLSSAAIYTLGVHCDDGDTYISLNGLVGKTVNLLNVSGDLVTESIKTLIEEGDLIEENANIFLPQLYHAEKNVAETL
ncbi:MAG: ATP-dependent RecD-like DNA helicase, partial [Clostridia bacterium]|nr:ATP-dependent RecD-like DNA helicase [Clostridia bacterium]